MPPSVFQVHAMLYASTLSMFLLRRLMPIAASQVHCENCGNVLLPAFWLVSLGLFPCIHYLGLHVKIRLTFTGHV